MIDAVQSNEADDDEIDGDDVVQQSRHDQDQNAGDEGNQRRNMGNGDGHEDLLGSQSMIMMVSARGFHVRNPLPFYLVSSSAKADDPVITEQSSDTHVDCRLIRDYRMPAYAGMTARVFTPRCGRNRQPCGSPHGFR